MSTIIERNVVKRQPGYLYFVDKSGNVCEAKMKNFGKKKSTAKKVVKKKTAKKAVKKTAKKAVKKTAKKAVRKVVKKAK